MSQSQTIPFAGPLYEQVHKMLRSRIVCGEWKQQALVPGEVVLSNELGVSVGTVRKAMDQLARENLVVRERGRGTFVKGDDEWQSMAGFKFFNTEGLPILPTIELDDARSAEASPAEAKVLKSRAFMSDMPKVIRFKRRWTSGDALLCRETIAVDANRFPGLLERANSDAATLHFTYAETFRTRIERIVWEIGSPHPGGLIDRPEGVAPDRVLYLSRLALDGRDAPVEICNYEVNLDNCSVQLAR